MRSRLISSSCAVLALLLAASGALGAKPASSVRQLETGSTHSPAVRLVAAALEAEAAGQIDSRDALLQQALDVDPDCAAAHWHLGDIRVGDRWVKIDEAMKEASTQGTVFEYNNRRNAAGKSAADQLALARWCRDQGLVEQHRAHAQLAIAADPEMIEAKSELSLCQFNGLWMTPTELADRERRAAEEKEQFERWKPQIEQLLRIAKKSSTARDALRDIDDPSAIPAIERLLSVKSDRMALVAVAALSNMKQQAATESLVRHAVMSSWDDVRKAAALALGERSLYSYAPLLLAGLEAPIEIDYIAVEEGIGSWNYRCHLFREGALADATYDAALRFQRVSSSVGKESELADDGRARAEAVQATRDSQQTLLRGVSARNEFAAQLNALNSRAAFVNARIGEALTIATAGTGAAPVLPKTLTAQRNADPTVDQASPRFWWNWWFDHNDIYRTSERPVTEFSNYERLSQPIVTSCECFVAGTPVWTPTGPMSIDLVQPGDLVLAKRPETGEVAYKAVLATTVRPPVALLKIRTGEAELIVTRGHPLWVSGQGWRMARQLETGDLLHTLSGPRAISSIEPAPKAKAYNLVVDGFNTYFAGPDRVLAHDNNLREPTDVVVPGLAAQP